MASSPRAFDLLNLDASREPLSRSPLIALTNQRLILSWTVEYLLPLDLNFENFPRLRARLALTNTLPI